MPSQIYGQIFRDVLRIKIIEIVVSNNITAISVRLLVYFGISTRILYSFMQRQDFHSLLPFTVLLLLMVDNVGLGLISFALTTTFTAINTVLWFT